MHGIIQQKNTKWIIVGLLSVILSFWMSVRESVINPDAICYLQSAINMKSGLYIGMHVCDQAKWPIYSLLIYLFSTITHLSAETSAYVLDGLFSLISVLTFVAIVRQISTKTRVFWLAAAVILLAHEFNSVRQYIVRDHGAWAFYLISVYFLLQYFRDYRWHDAVFWSLSIIIATLFRVEGAIYLLLVPLCCLFDFRRTIFQRIKSFLQLHMIIILGGIALLLVRQQIEVARLHELQFQLFNGAQLIWQHFNDLKQSLATNVLVTDSAHEAGIVLFFMLASWYVFSVITNLSIIYSILVIYAWIKHSLRAENYVYLALWAYIIVSVLITAAFLSEHLFLSKRYLMSLSLIFMIWVPFALDDLFQQWQSRKWPVILAIFFIMVSAIGGIFDFGYSKKYLRDSGDWLSANVPVTATLYSNDYQVLYYSHHFDADLFDKAREFANMNSVANGKWKKFDYLAVRINKKDKTGIVNEIKYSVVQVFSNKRGDQVVIYRRSKL